MKIAALLLMALVTQDTEYDQIKNKLEAMKISVDFQETPVADAVEYIRKATDLNIVVDDRIIWADKNTVTLKVKNLSVKSILKLMVHELGMSAVYKAGVIYIAPKGGVWTKMVTQIYELRDLVLKVEDFEAPKVELSYGQSGIALIGWW